MRLADLLKETLNVDSQDIWKNERTLTPVRRFGVRLHIMGLSIRETVAILELLGVDCSQGAVWQWTHRLADSESDPSTAEPSRVVVDATPDQLGTEWYWLYAAVDLDSLYLLDVEVFSVTRPIQPRRFTTNSPRTTTSPIPNLWSMRTAIGLLCPD